MVAHQNLFKADGSITGEKIHGENKDKLWQYSIYLNGTKKGMEVCQEMLSDEGIHSSFFENSKPSHTGFVPYKLRVSRIHDKYIFAKKYLSCPIKFERKAKIMEYYFNLYESKYPERIAAVV